MTNDDQYVPSEKAVRRAYTYYYDSAAIRRSDVEQEFDRFLARVRRDAAREALDGLADEVTHVDWDLDGPAFALRVRRFKNRNYPEETT